MGPTPLATSSFSSKTNELSVPATLSFFFLANIVTKHTSLFVHTTKRREGRAKEKLCSEGRKEGKHSQVAFLFSLLPPASKQPLSLITR